MQFRSTLLRLIALMLLSLPATVLAHGSERIHIQVRNGSLHADSFILGVETTLDKGVFLAGELEDLGGGFLYTDLPGFAGLTTGGNNSGALLSFTVLDFLFWDGSTPAPGDTGPHFTDPTGESIALSIGAQTFTSGNTFLTVPHDHRHLGFTLSSSDLDGIVDPGIYALLAKVGTNQAGIGESDPFVLLFNVGLSPAAFHDAAAQATSQFIVPEPSMAMAAVGAMGLLVMRRRR
jgi:hypothetical protein